jgi:hypothetical protein
MPCRIIRESARYSPTLWALPAEAERLFWRLTTVADDWGRFDADPRLLLAQCFPLGVEALKVSHIAGWFAEMVAVGLVRIYAVEGWAYGVFVSWAKHQRQRNSQPRLPALSAEELPYLVDAAGCRKSQRTAATRRKVPQVAARARPCVSPYPIPSYLFVNL